MGNLVRADVGPVRAATLLAMAAIFVAALVLPDAWRQGPGLLDPPLTLALAYLVTRAVQLVVLLWASADDPPLRSTLRFFVVPVTAAWLPLVVGALLGGVTQTVLWTVAFLVDIGGARVASAYRAWPLRSLDHFTERFGLVLIIALGEALIAAGTGPRTMAPTGAGLVAALLSLVVTVCLWWLYFDRLAPAARNSVLLVPRERRSHVAGDAYGLAHAPLIIGAIYVALGIEQVLGQLTEETPHTSRLSWPSATALVRGRHPLPARTAGLPPAHPPCRTPGAGCRRAAAAAPAAGRAVAVRACRVGPAHPVADRRNLVRAAHRQAW
ncbi:Low temperature requirement A [Micromonospora lupini str. Lupac 08]|uniref:Low temperature requirement A n=1 Tax=Micromonospora lupini str. Lupac 08 TaxID=1150864 RepID=I0L2U1_9ACTN|nr:Low temperature requirement A [Micromonospora lupini str. Lupac 08]